MSSVAPPAARAAAEPAAEAETTTSIAATAARLHAAAASLPAPGVAFVDASASPEFLRDVLEVRQRSVKLLSRLQKASASGEPLLGDDPRAARDAVARVLDPLVERLTREKDEKKKNEEDSAAAMHAPSWGSSRGGPLSPLVPLPGSASSASHSRPQDAFEPRVNNDRGAAFAPPGRGWRACCRVADGGEGSDFTSFLLEDDEEEEAANASASASAAPQCAYHPLERLLSSLDTCVQPWQLEGHGGRGERTPSLSPPPPPLASTPFAFVDTPSALSSLVSRWLSSGVTELAFDLEAHSFHSFQGFTCLIQLSTRTEDAVVDALSPGMRSCVGPLLAPLFADPRVAKVAHGARHDISWLQRDFGLFVGNLFDTGLAAGLVGRPRGLGALYEQMLGFAADKKWQTADWRVRPLPRAALNYAREDTHWLLHVADRLKQELASKKGGDGNSSNSSSSSLLSSAYEASRLLCLCRYDVERFSRRRALALAATVGGLRAPGAAREVFLSLADWRDAKARLLDESTGAVLPKGLMAKIAKRAADSASSPLSFDAAALRSAVGGGGSPCMVSRYSREVVDSAREGLRRWERLRSGEVSEEALREGDDEGDGDGDDDEGGGGGNGNGKERGSKGSLPSRPVAATSAPEPMLLNPTSSGAAAANNAVPFNRRREGGGNPAAAAPAAAAVVLVPASGEGGKTSSLPASSAAAAAAFAPSPMAASSFFGSACAPVRKQQQPPQLSFSMPLAFAPAKAPASPPLPATTDAAAAAAAVLSAALASEKAAAKKGRFSEEDDFLPVPLGDLRPGAQRASRGGKKQQEEQEEEEDDEQRKKRKSGAPGDGDTEADAAVASILQAGRRAMAVSSSSTSSSSSSESEGDSGSGSSGSGSGSEQDSDSNEGPGEVAVAAAAAAAAPPRSRLQQPNNTAAAAAAARRLSTKKRPSPATSFDFEAKIAASPGIVSAAEPPAPADGGRGRGRSGASARGRGRGRLGSNRDLLPAGPAPPTAAFNPYALGRLGEIKGGKRSGTMPKSGNKSKSFV